MDESLTKVQNVNIKDLKLLEDNPRQISRKELANLASSISEDPDYLRNRPILVNRVDGVLNVYAGNQRVRAAKKLKWKQIPCIVDDDLDENTVKKRIIKDNRHGGEWDFDILANEWDLNFLLECGFTEKELELTLDYSEEKSEKEKKIKTCPHCGEEL